MTSVAQFPPNWTVIQHIRDQREQNEKQRKAAAAASQVAPKAPSKRKHEHAFGSTALGTKVVPMGCRASVQPRLNISREQPATTSQVIDLTIDSPEDACTSVGQASTTHQPSLATDAPERLDDVPTPADIVPQQGNARSLKGIFDYFRFGLS